ncbi:unnamed protein product [Mytilus edulis]|uniref:C-type lectin domain-containing protein n=1 Tax=Mytilus edulis TaxID=6550 RepID=A0A8S3VEC1_MYTED|nr:unnamed protein product [Mytilus edulis]
MKSQATSINSKIQALDKDMTSMEEDFKRARQWIKYNNHCCYFGDDEVIWTEAERKCREIGGYLVKIDDSAENSWILEQIKKVANIYGAYNTLLKRATHGGVKIANKVYFMITSDIEAFVISSDIGISYRSDHSPVFINLKFSSQIRGKGTWKFNDSLLKETEFIEKVKGDIKTVIEEYESDPSIDIEKEDKQFNISYQLLWDMIKMKVRGSAISFSSFQKKEQNNKEKELLYKISLLDKKKKLIENNLPSVHQESEELQLELKVIREKMLKG